MDEIGDAELADALEKLAQRIKQVKVTAARAWDALLPKPEPPSEPIAGDNEDGVRL